MSARVLLIDNYDSFTYNLVQALRVLGAEVEIHRNDKIDPAAARACSPTHLLISPGPGRPENAGISIEMIRTFTGEIPILGVCLGHQAIVSAAGGEIVSAKHLMHGKPSPVYHDNRTLYQGLPNPFDAGRYHSLAAADDALPECLTVSSYTSEGEIMGVRRKDHLVEGVQFHPESVLTPHGNRLLRNFLDLEIVGRQPRG